MTDTLGFIGLGHMGEPIAANLLAAGFGLGVHNRTASKAAPRAGKGAHAARTAPEVATRGGFVLAMVADDHALEEVCLPKGSFVEKLGAGGIHVTSIALGIAEEAGLKPSTHTKVAG